VTRYISTADPRIQEGAEGHPAAAEAHSLRRIFCEEGFAATSMKLMGEELYEAAVGAHDLDPMLQGAGEQAADSTGWCASNETRAIVLSFTKLEPAGEWVATTLRYEGVFGTLRPGAGCVAGSHRSICSHRLPSPALGAGRWPVEGS